LAVVDFAHFDPEGGEPSDNSVDDMVAVATAPRPKAQSVAPPEPEPEPEVEPELEIIESVSELATSLPPLPPQENEPKPKPAPQPVVSQKTETGVKGDEDEDEAKLSSGGSAQQAQGGLGGGPGEDRGSLGGGSGEGQGGTGGSGQGNPNELNAYLAQVQRSLIASIKYPSAARSRNLKGVATVSFILTPDGRVLSSRLVSSSGHTILDDEVMALLRRVSPFPPRPKALPQDNLSLTVPIQFSLH